MDGGVRDVGVRFLLGGSRRDIIQGRRQGVPLMATISPRANDALLLYRR